MTTTHGFELLREQVIGEINATARLYRHAATGAELLSLINDDENKVFGVNFRTPPTDSTGVAHILEHSVLCGSAKYPVKEPFVELMKSSLNTFLNAMTYPDKTCYPVASQNTQDFYNLIDVYLDAVFFPRLTPEIFQQEGWHYELEAPDAPMTYKGVVFNEMKGNYSSPESMLRELSQRSLYPDITYGLDSGGDPRHIPDLTYAQFKAFHQRLYHPSNAKLFFYGDDDPDERLRLLEAYLGGFQRISVDAAVPLQTRFTAPKRLSRTYAAGSNEHGSAKETMLTVNWMLDEPGDVETALALGILEHILIGTPASPLYKALIDSGLGEGLAGGGLDEDLRQPMFSIGLKGIDTRDADKVEGLINDTIGTLARQGIDPMATEAALNTVEFSLRENNTGSFPRGIAFMLRALRGWLHGRDPLAWLAFAVPLAAVKARAGAGNRYFEGLLERHLVANPHRTVLILQPDRAQAEREAEEEAARLAQARSAMNAAEIEAVIAGTQALKRAQETPDSPDALATIPTLKVADLPRQNKTIPIEVTRLRDTPVLYHDLFTNGVVYLDLGFDLHTLAPSLLPYVPLFGRALLETGLGEEDFVRLSQRIGRSTGGIWPQRWSSTVPGAARCAAWFCLRAKALPHQTGELLAILRDILTEARLDNRERFQQLVLEEKAAVESRLVPAGSGYVDRRLRASFHEADWAEEQMSGLSYLFFLRKLAADLEANWEGVAATLEQIRRTLVNTASMLCNVTAEVAHWRDLEPRLGDLIGSLPRAAAASADWQVAAGPSGEGFTIPSKVNYVGKGADLYKLGLKPSGANLVVRRYLRTTWLWEKVRVQGGAYGGQCMFDRFSGGFTFVSYRDPNLLPTLDIYDRSAEFLRGSNLDETELSRNIIGTIGEVDTYRLPDAKGFASMQRYLIGDTDAARQVMREEILSTTAADVRSFADVLAEVAASGRIVVLGSDQAIAAANAQRQGFLQVSKVM
ncbi:MAG TPA: insulinase family protein [Xanthobacteraceae bacterium]|nr:insulinase family protein [Xanthobacteraceae bacterium]